MSIELESKRLLKEHKQEFEVFFEKLIETNKLFNLTAIVEKNEVFDKHFADSLASVGLIEENSKVLDIGAGAGFPSIPLKIARNDLEITMLDSINKRVNFLNETTALLELKNITAIHGRAEDFALLSDFREKFDVVVVRAVAGLNTLLEYCVGFLKLGGIIIAYKGNNFALEIESAKRASEILGLELSKTINYKLKESELIRTLVIYKKIKETPSNYPRDKNQAKLNPL